MSKFIDLTGQVFNRWTVLSFSHRDKWGQIVWLCQCVCGNKGLVGASNLKRGISKSCGCLKKEIASKRYTIDIIGKVYGRWTVIKRVENNKRGQAMWLCRCECGTEKILISTNIKRGGSKSCGCFKKDSRKRGIESSSWRGGTKKHYGYVYIYMPTHPNSHDTYVAEHIYVMSQIIGRPLTKDETVHHKNGIKADNTPENLELWASRHPKGQRISDLVAWAKEILRKYEPIVLK
jgi:hypothetical protein